MSAVTGTAGQRGFDANHVVSLDDAKAFAEMGYVFALRYIRRTAAAANDVTAGEIENLHAAGLSVGIVQHFGPAEGWVPTEALGLQYGTTAAITASACGVPDGVNVWLDLEGVLPGTDPQQITDYCNAWWGAVGANGYLPGLYVGWGNGLTPAQLHGLRFTRYWASYNLNEDQYPATCGVSMRQTVAHGTDMPDRITYPIDVDLVTGDALGRFPMFYGAG